MLSDFYFYYFNALPLTDRLCIYTFCGRWLVNSVLTFDLDILIMISSASNTISHKVDHTHLVHFDAVV